MNVGRRLPSESRAAGVYIDGIERAVNRDDKKGLVAKKGRTANGASGAELPAGAIRGVGGVKAEAAGAQVIVKQCGPISGRGGVGIFHRQ